MKEQAINILQADNHTIYGILWNASEKPKAVLQIVHGMTEHIDRYRKFAEELNRYGHCRYRSSAISCAFCYDGDCKNADKIQWI